jgi:hypothetical protein
VLDEIIILKISTTTNNKKTIFATAFYVGNSNFKTRRTINFMRTLTNWGMICLWAGIILFYGCDSDDNTSGGPGNETNEVEIITTPAFNITDSTAVSGGTITTESNASILERGLCWGPMQSPDFEDSYLPNGFGTGAYFIPLQNLLPESTYYMRAYAVLENDTLFGNELSFSTLETNLLPVVETSEVSNIESTSATAG